MRRSHLLAFAACVAAGAIGLTGCDAKSAEGSPEPQSTAKAVPSWIEDPGSFYEPRREDAVLAVGQGRSAGSVSMARTMAMADARKNLMKARAAASGAAQGSGTDEGLSGTISGVQTLATFTAEDGTYYVLVE